MWVGLRMWEDDSLLKYESLGLTNLVKCNQTTTNVSWLDDGKCLLHDATHADISTPAAKISKEKYLEKQTVL
jgi:hypothetical protein